MAGKREKTKESIIHAEAEVKALQKALGIAETGVFDAATNKKLFEFTVKAQTEHNARNPSSPVKIDGWMGPKTLETIGGNPEVYDALRRLDEKVAKERGMEDRPPGAGLKTLQFRTDSHPPKGQELSPAAAAKITGTPVSEVRKAEEDDMASRAEAARGSSPGGSAPQQPQQQAGASSQPETTKTASGEPAEGSPDNSNLLWGVVGGTAAVVGYTALKNAWNSGKTAPPADFRTAQMAEPTPTKAALPDDGAPSPKQGGGRVPVLERQNGARVGAGAAGAADDAVKGASKSAFGKVAGALTTPKGNVALTAGASALVAGAEIADGGSAADGAKAAGDLLPGVNMMTADTAVERKDAMVTTGGAAGGAAIGAGIGVWFGGVGAVPGAAIGALVGGTSAEIYNAFSSHSVEDLEKSQGEILKNLPKKVDSLESDTVGIARMHWASKNPDAAGDAHKVDPLELFRDPDIRQNVINSLQHDYNAAPDKRTDEMYDKRRTIKALEEFGELEDARRESLRAEPANEKQRAIVAEIADKVPSFTVVVATASGASEPIGETAEEVTRNAARLLQDPQIRNEVRAHYQQQEKKGSPEIKDEAAYALAGLNHIETGEKNALLAAQKAERDSKNALDPMQQMASQPVPVF